MTESTNPLIKAAAAVYFGAGLVSVAAKAVYAGAKEFAACLFVEVQESGISGMREGIKCAEHVRGSAHEAKALVIEVAGRYFFEGFESVKSGVYEALKTLEPLPHVAREGADFVEPFAREVKGALESGFKETVKTARAVEQGAKNGAYGVGALAEAVLSEFLEMSASGLNEAKKAGNSALSCGWEGALIGEALFGGWFEETASMFVSGGGEAKKTCVHIGGIAYQLEEATRESVGRFCAEILGALASGSYEAVKTYTAASGALRELLMGPQEVTIRVVTEVLLSVMSGVHETEKSGHAFVHGVDEGTRAPREAIERLLWEVIETGRVTFRETEKTGVGAFNALKFVGQIGQEVGVAFAQEVLGAIESGKGEGAKFIHAIVHNEPLQESAQALVAEIVGMVESGKTEGKKLGHHIAQIGRGGGELTREQALNITLEIGHTFQAVLHEAKKLDSGLRQGMPDLFYVDILYPAEELITPPIRAIQKKAKELKAQMAERRRQIVLQATVYKNQIKLEVAAFKQKLQSG